MSIVVHTLHFREKRSYRKQNSVSKNVGAFDKWALKKNIRGDVHNIDSFLGEVHNIVSFLCFFNVGKAISY